MRYLFLTLLLTSCLPYVKQGHAQSGIIIKYAEGWAVERANLLQATAGSAGLYITFLSIFKIGPPHAEDKIQIDSSRSKR